MEFVNTKKMFELALKQKFAIGAFNVFNFETINAVLQGASNKNSPVILQFSPNALKYLSIENAVNFSKTIANKLKIANVCLHLDHAENFLTCKKCIEAGFNSVMIDGSELSFKENVRLTKKVVKLAHKHNVTVEGEIGTVSKNGNQSFFTEPTIAQKFVRLTGIDSLAVSVGTSHGLHKAKDCVQINFDLLNKISALLPDFPLVLHGASSIPNSLVKKFNRFGGELENAHGVSESDIENLCKTSVCKINIASDLNLCFSSSLRECFSKEKNQTDPKKYLLFCQRELQKLVEQKIILLNSYNKNKSIK